MNRQSPHSMQIVKREEKEAKLFQFVLGEIAAGRVSLDGEWIVTALSMESPVISALRRVVNELGEASLLQLRVILTRSVDSAHLDGFEDVSSIVVHTGQSSRLLDAHEQLVLGAVSSWTGDCMRRDPQERDAFELFGDDNRELADWAVKSFERIWAMTKPVKHTYRQTATNAGVADMDDVLASEGMNQQTIVAATSRH